MSWPLSRPGCGVRVWFPASPGWGLLVVVCPPCCPLCVPSPLFLFAASLGAVFPWCFFPALGGVLDAGSGPPPWCFPLGGPVLALPVRV